MKEKKLKHIKEYIDPEIESTEDMLLEMANLTSDITGLPMMIWISPKNARHGPRIKVRNDYANKMSSDNLFVVTIEETPRVIGDTGKLKPKDVNLVIIFVQNNIAVLLDYWNGKETSLQNVFKRFNK